MGFTGCSCENCHNKMCSKRVPIFSAFNEDELSRVSGLIIRRQYKKGELIILEGACPESLIIINSGRVKAYRNTIEGREHILYIFSEGDFFGEKNLLLDHEATYNAEALEDTGICTINKKAFQELMREYPELSFKVMEELCSRLARLENTIESMGTKNVELRVNSVLVEFSEKYGSQHPRGILVELPMSREGIANYIGLTRETVSRKMSLLQEEGIIEMVGNKKVIILDMERLSL
ncbi:Crp/Fnr family transcriptional regulator [Ruminiclostridium cellobioparum]|uniref:Crp/FNR family transcriptional regulator n=1 Tax=Ruminiclostridium cellobioparum subsp. termitidis CT1112 TaxID=1195236 RepID=S0FIZ1_RUMCE|nr:Crp/Fnr family transcriptional regulator [Ruminiclostridium cellobioparum]EMS72025.1 Crp/FNR family transcriptional regulator [Ruminiclostridium cellobioparum subsp. termitidis CT1112]